MVETAEEPCITPSPSPPSWSMLLSKKTSSRSISTVISFVCSTSIVSISRNIFCIFNAFSYLQVSPVDATTLSTLQVATMVVSYTYSLHYSIINSTTESSVPGEGSHRHLHSQVDQNKCDRASGHFSSSISYLCGQY